MIELHKCNGKHVKTTCFDGEVFQGEADWYCPPQDNEDEIATICVGIYELKENEIKSIELLMHPQ